MDLRANMMIGFSHNPVCGGDEPSGAHRGRIGVGPADFYDFCFGRVDVAGALGPESGARVMVGGRGSVFGAGSEKLSLTLRGPLGRFAITFARARVLGCA